MVVCMDPLGNISSLQDLGSLAGCGVGLGFRGCRGLSSDAYHVPET